jgi:hypothetical protein
MWSLGNIYKLQDKVANVCGFAKAEQTFWQQTRYDDLADFFIK